MSRAELAETLKRHDVKQPYVVIDEALRADIRVATALAMLQMETGIPQRNIFGHDPGAPFQGLEVTPARVKALLASPHANGVGWTQLTYKPFVEKAQAAGGAHIPRFQMRVGFKVLRDLYNQFGSIESMFSHYNGSGAAATAYGQKATAIRANWLKTTNGR